MLHWRRVHLNKFLALSAAGMWIGCSTKINADSVLLSASADATLIETAPDNSSGGAGFFNSGTTQNNTKNRALIQFDITGIPQSALITAVSLQLEVIRAPSDGFEASPFSLHRVLRSWGEGSTLPLNNPGGLGGPAAPGDATWNYRFAFDQPWGVPGGEAGVDYAAASSAGIIIYGTENSPYSYESTPEAVADVQFWLDHPESNFGWMLMSDFEDTPFTARHFGSREDPLGRGSLLTVEYALVPEPGTTALGVMGVIVLAGSLRHRIFKQVCRRATALGRPVAASLSRRIGPRC